MPTSTLTSLKNISPDILKSLSKEWQDPAWLLTLRLQALAHFEALPWPGPRDEKWKRADLETITWDTLAPAPQNSIGLTATPAERWTPLVQAIKQNESKVRSAWETAVENSKLDKFRSLNLALANDGQCLFIGKNEQNKTPFQSAVSAKNDSSAHFLINFVFIDEGAEAHVWEKLDGSAAFVSSFTSVHLGDNAKGGFYYVQEWTDQTAHFQFQDITQGAHSKFNAVAVEVGGRIFHNETTVNLKGTGAENKVLGLLFGEGNQNFENWVTQNHIGTKTTSDIQYRGALKGASKSFFSGMVSIEKQAQQSDAYQAAKYLLLSKDARADAIPNLEILADDVKCSHGAAVGPVDEDQKYYMQTRGIPPLIAEDIIVEGFFEPVLAELPSEAVQERLRTFVEEKLHR